MRALHVRVCPSPVSIQYPGKVDPRDFSMGVKKLSQHSTFGPPKDMNRTLPDGYLKKRTGEPTLPERTSSAQSPAPRAARAIAFARQEVS